jgi:ribosomal-protein-alanine N-acetyltransferase
MEVNAGGVIVRFARPEDITGVVSLERSVIEAAHWAEDEYSTMIRSEVGENVRRCLLVAESGGNLVGFAVGRVIVGEVRGELENIAVAEGARRLGTGRALCEAMMTWFRGVGAKGAELEVRSANRIAATLYQSLGFAPAGVRKGYYREPVDDAVLMRVEFVDRR